MKQDQYVDFHIKMERIYTRVYTNLIYFIFYFILFCVRDILYIFIQSQNCNINYDGEDMTAFN